MLPLVARLLNMGLTRVSIPDPSVPDAQALYDGRRQGNDASFGTSILGDRRYVIFYSMAHDLVTDNFTGAPNAFVHGRTTGETRRICDPGIGKPGTVVIGNSRDGRYVLLFDRENSESTAGTLGKADVFVTPLSVSASFIADLGLSRFAS